MQDTYGRTINYMRISVTDRCNLRCRYCMPHGIEKTSMDEILTFEEMTEAASAAVGIGITRFKVTGGEPLARLGVTDFIGMLKSIPGVEQVTLTTNGVLLSDAIDDLIANGLDAVNISLDTLDESRYEQITGRNELRSVLSAIDDCLSRGIKTKINTVPMKGVNEDDLLPLVRLAKDNPLFVRFIEMMPIGHGARFQTIDNNEVLQRIRVTYPDMEQDDTPHGNGPATYYVIPGFTGGIGFISAMHDKFCDSCNRLRLTSKGECKLCLCFDDSVDLRAILRDNNLTNDEREEKLKSALQKAVSLKPKAHQFERPGRMTELRDMVSIGG